MNILRSYTGSGARLNNMDRLETRIENRKKRKAIHRKHLLHPVAVYKTPGLVAKHYLEHTQPVLSRETKGSKISKGTRISIIISLTLHIIAFSTFAFIKLYYREPSIENEMPVAFVKAQNTRVLRRSDPIRPVILLNESLQNYRQKQAGARQVYTPSYTSSDVFYTDVPRQVFSTFGNMEQTNLKTVRDVKLPPAIERSLILDPIAPESLREVYQPEMQTQLSITSGRDFLNEVASINVKPSLSQILQRFAQTVRRKIESQKRYPLAARKSMIEGRVGIKMTILKNGQLERVEIVNSSGYAILDNAALESVYTSAPFPPFPNEAERKRVQMSIYLVFQIV